MALSDPFQTDHATLRAITAGLRQMAQRPEPPQRAILTEARWQLFRTLLRLFTLKDRLLYTPLSRHPDPDIARKARHFAVENEALYELFITRSESWTPERAEAEWPRYRVTLEQVTEVIDTRVGLWETDLLPHLPGAPAPNGESLFEHDWTKEEDRMRAFLGLPRPQPIARPISRPS